MTALPFLLLGLVAASLAGTIAWQLDPPSQDGVQVPVRVAIPAAAPVAAPELTEGRAGQLATASLARPLFNPDRRPPRPGPATPAAPDAPLPRLTGVMVSQSGRSAIFAGSPQPVVVQVGGRVGAFTVQAIEPGQVTLQGPDGTRLVRPSFEAGRPAAPPAPRTAPGLPLLPPSLPPPAATGLPLATPAPSPALPDGPEGAMPFNQNPAPSGLDILRNLTRKPDGNQAPPQ